MPAVLLLLILYVPTERARNEFDPDYTVWMDTIDKGRYEDTNAMFENHSDAIIMLKNGLMIHMPQLLLVVQRYMEKNNV